MAPSFHPEAVYNDILDAKVERERERKSIF
jgi:hypothetical protein